MNFKSLKKEIPYLRLDSELPDRLSITEYCIVISRKAGRRYKDWKKMLVLIDKENKAIQLKSISDNDLNGFNIHFGKKIKTTGEPTNLNITSQKGFGIAVGKYYYSEKDQCYILSK